MGQLLGQERWEADGPSCCPSLERLLYAELATQNVQPIKPERRELARTEPGVGACQHERSPHGLDSFGEMKDLGGVEETLLVLLDSRKTDAATRGAGNPSILDRKLEGHLEKSQRTLHTSRRGFDARRR